jgi:hypothetical protein
MMATLLAAGAPVAAAAIQADADKSIARINQETAIQTTQISADTSKYLASTQKSISDAQIEATKQIASTNNGETTNRLEMQLAALKEARQENASLQREKRDLEKQLNDERIALAKKQAEDYLALGQATLSSRVSQAGMTTGFASAQGSANRLSVTRTLTDRTGTLASTGSLVGTGVSSPPIGGAPLSTTGRVNTANGRQQSTQGLGVARRVTSQSRLLATLQQSSLESSVMTGRPMRGRGVRSGRMARRVSLSRRFTASSGRRSFSAGRALRQVMRSNLEVAGSAPGRRSGSDLARYQAQVSDSPAESFAQFRSRPVMFIGGPAVEVESARHATAPSRSGYNAPELPSSTHTISSGTSNGFFNLPTR